MTILTHFITASIGAFIGFLACGILGMNKENKRLIAYRKEIEQLKKQIMITGRHRD